MECVPGTRREKELRLTEKGKAYTKEVLSDIYAVEEEAITETETVPGLNFCELFVIINYLICVRTNKGCEWER